MEVVQLIRVSMAAPAALFCRVAGTKDLAEFLWNMDIISDIDTFTTLEGDTVLRVLHRTGMSICSIFVYIIKIKRRK